MSILVDTIRVAGFRGIKSLEVTLPRVAVLIGLNNSGKTSLLKALHLILGDYSRFLSEEDFHIDFDGKRAPEILIDLRIIATDKDGDPTNLFNQEWASEFGDKIKAEANGRQFLAIRSRSKANLTKGGFDTFRSTLEKWPDLTTWETDKTKESRINSRLQSIPFISIEAQRDIHHELKDKFSFVGKVLSSIDYSNEVIAKLESQIKAVNDEAVSNSAELQNLKAHLENLNHSFHGSGNAEITPFPKKIRDLSKHFSVHFGETTGNTFSMEYHGMGTRSWASMLTVKAFTDLLAEKHEKEVEPFFPVLAAEEPEAHLHPNAQKTLYHQLADSKGQVIISTHSPYLASMADVNHIRSFCKKPAGITAHSLSYSVSDEEKKILCREIMMKRAEVLFSRAMILCEGITEEQIIPSMFEIYTKKSLFNLGVTCISVGGKNYAPFVKLACSFGIPTFIVSDNDGTTKSDIDNQMNRLKKETGLPLGADIFGLSYLTAGNNFETELLKTIGLKQEIIHSLVLQKTSVIANIKYTEAKRAELSKLSDDELLSIMSDAKASYAGFLADVLRDNPYKKLDKDILPSAVKIAFDTIKGWIDV